MRLHHKIHAMPHVFFQLSLFLGHTKRQIVPTEYCHLTVLCCVFHAEMFMTLSSQLKGTQSAPLFLRPDDVRHREHGKAVTRFNQT